MPSDILNEMSAYSGLQTPAPRRAMSSHPPVFFFFVCVCVCVCVCACIHACMHTYIRIYIPICIHVYAYACTQTCVCVCIVFICVYIYTHTYLYTHTLEHTYRDKDTGREVRERWRSKGSMSILHQQILRPTFLMLRCSIQTKHQAKATFSKLKPPRLRTLATHVPRSQHTHHAKFYEFANPCTLTHTKPYTSANPCTEYA